MRAASTAGRCAATKAARDLVAGHLGRGFGLKELGDFRLRDLAARADLPAHPCRSAGGFPPIGTVAARTGNLPLQVSSFIGRVRELQQTAAALSGEGASGDLDGAGGGVGKTRLALRAAEEVAARFSDGAWLCRTGPGATAGIGRCGCGSVSSHRLGRPEQQRRFGGVLAR